MPGYWWVAGLALIAAAGWVTSVFVALRQVRDERRRRTPAEPRAQAARVSVWPGPRSDPQPVALLNRSDEPVYEAVATFVFIDGSGPMRGEEVPPELAARRVRVGVLPPGRWRVPGDRGWGGMVPGPGAGVGLPGGAGGVGGWAQPAPPPGGGTLGFATSGNVVNRWHGAPARTLIEPPRRYPSL